MNSRGKWQGMLTIARFNWPFYVSALVILLASVVAFFLFSTPTTKVICGLVVVGTTYFLVGSLGVSHLIYDRSDLYGWKWLDRALRGAEKRHFIFCHSGFDESSQVLRSQLGDVGWQILNHFNATQMTEASIRRARLLFPPTPDTLAADYQKWPISANSADVVFGLLAIHELRSEEERTAWFLEARRCLKRGGRVVLVEHLRDVANFVAFGPGFMHFHSRKSWCRVWETAGFSSFDEFCITPWVRVFVLVAP